MMLCHVIVSEHVIRKVIHRRSLILLMEIAGTFVYIYIYADNSRYLPD
jgi:hypothetical protein